ncbi:sigma-70 family RNA polymerase sigma factor [Corallococcus sp. AB004]|uniref:RNA polymerase sigma factor n=1 Tax=Corallococcus TaxID=83461 RepID=UPI000EA34C10|nr:sigma-70 family RNA polymerase sigma factor [Corallococcus sp. AB038B]NPC70739.1 sigma-70 family RNA polymerase sigma factor [Corallococcus exiguus]RKI45075.1 sigma-70 family RNA polymerase sigma factor [Corallococcus sp. AB004]NPD25012.1 sigma-70 family RNA polymerase sigma factor [Corallococcus exiguus]NRD43369.1 sigma-70 family RNA polymerase sigma factor [Corallococcus exiguus]RKH93506.1 sigma-70 family RNA polymerase sigma factor [Corallococcus sp. AB038B]
MSPGGVLDVGQQALAPEAQADPRRVEQALLVRLRRGDPEAFESLVHQHQDRLYDFCFRMVGDREEAHDLVQEIFVSVHQHVRRFREDARLSTWLFRISKNHCLNRLKYLQRRGRGRSEVFDEVSAAAIAEGGGAPPQPDAALDAARERARVQRAISQLDPDARMLVALRDIEGLSYDEIVDITELPEGTVKSRLHRAREKLADLLGRFEP